MAQLHLASSRAWHVRHEQLELAPEGRAYWRATVVDGDIARRTCAGHPRLYGLPRRATSIYPSHKLVRRSSRLAPTGVAPPLELPRLRSRAGHLLA